MKALFILLLLMPLSIMAQIDYNYNQVDRLSTQHPIKKIMWLKSAQNKQSVSFDHLVFFVSESNNEDIAGDNVILNIHHNNEIIHTKEFTTMSKAPNSVYLLSPINLKPKDSVYLILTLKPNPNSTQSSYLINIVDRTQFLRKNPVQYREMISYEVTPTHTTTTTQPKHQYPISKGMLGEIYNPNKPRKKKKSGNGWIDVLEFITGL